MQKNTNWIKFWLNGTVYWNEKKTAMDETAKIQARANNESLTLWINANSLIYSTGTCFSENVLYKGGSHLISQGCSGFTVYHCRKAKCLILFAQLKITFRLRTGQLSSHGRYLQMSHALLFTLATIPLISPATVPFVALVQASEHRWCWPPSASSHQPLSPS